MFAAFSIFRIDPNFIISCIFRACKLVWLLCCRGKFVLLLLKISKRKIDALGPPFLMMLFFFLDKQTEIMY